MSTKLILTTLVLALMTAGAEFWALAPAQDKGQVKSPGPIRPLPPAKPQESPRPAPTETPAAALPTQLRPPMTAAAIQRALGQESRIGSVGGPPKRRHCGHPAADESRNSHRPGRPERERR